MNIPPELEAELKAIGVSRLAPHILAHLAPCIKMSLTLAGRWDSSTDLISDETPIGASKYGGYPDVPPGFEWPLVEDMPLPFLAQIRLEEVAPFDVENVLPHQGFLLFFFDTTLEIYWETAILHVEDTTQLARLAPHPDLPEFGVNEPFAISFSPGWSLPSARSREVTAIFEEYTASDEEIDAYAQWYGGTNDNHQLLGHAFYDHYDLRPLASCVEAGYGFGDEASKEQREQWETDAPNWRCLLQFGYESEEDHEGGSFGIEWGNRSCAYFLIRDSDLHAHDFKNVIAV